MGFSHLNQCKRVKLKKGINSLPPKKSCDKQDVERLQLAVTLARLGHFNEFEWRGSKFDMWADNSLLYVKEHWDGDTRFVLLNDFPNQIADLKWAPLACIAEAMDEMIAVGV